MFFPCTGRRGRGRGEGRLTAEREGGRVCTCVATCYVHVSLQINRREGKYAQNVDVCGNTTAAVHKGGGRNCQTIF